MLPKPDKNPSPIGNGRGIDEWNAPGPVIQGKKPRSDNFEDPVRTPEQKKAKAEEMAKRLTVIEKQLYGTDTGYGQDTAEHELDHALKAPKNRSVKFRLAYDANTNDIIPGIEANGLSPKERMVMASGT